MSSCWCVPTLIALALAVAAAAEAPECAQYLNDESRGLYALCMAKAPVPEATQRRLRALPGLDAHPYGQDQEHQRIYQSDPEYRRRHDQNMIRNHGMGGCTPNFSTGGCL